MEAKIKNQNKNKKTGHPVQQIIKLVFAGLFAIFVGVIFWLGRDFFSDEVNLNIYGFSKEVAMFLEKIYQWTPIILLSIYVVEFVLVTILIKKNINNGSNDDVILISPKKVETPRKKETEKYIKVCRIICIVLAVIAILFSIFMNFAFGIFPKIVGHIITFEESADILELMRIIVSGFFGLLMVQIIVLALPLMAFKQQGWMNVVTWLLLFIPGVESAIAVIWLIIKFFSGVRVSDSDEETYDVIIIKKQ